MAPAGLDALYGLPLEEFTAARNALAKNLAAAGDKAAAAEVKGLTKPSKTAWALNQLARRQAADVEALLAAGRRLRRAQQQALDGDAADLREATRAEHDQVNRLVDAALSVLGNAGALADRLRSTLHAAATEPEAGELLRQGRLVTDLEPLGFGLEGLAGTEVVPDDRTGDDRAGDDRAARQAPKEAEREAERLRREAERLHDRARRLLEEADRAERRAQEARAEAEAAADAAAEADRGAVEASGRVEELKRS